MATLPSAETLALMRAQAQVAFRRNWKSKRMDIAPADMLIILEAYQEIEAQNESRRFAVEGLEAQRDAALAAAEHWKLQVTSDEGACRLLADATDVLFPVRNLLAERPFRWWKAARRLRRELNGILDRMEKVGGQ